jgi:radical SAM enzyme (TIGR01210 family)
VVTSVGLAASRFDAISVNPVHIQNGTVVEWLFRRGRYRPPWLWSLVEAMQAGAARRGDTRLVTFPTAGGLARGPHNCGTCDRTVLAALEEASLSQTFGGLDGLTCACRGRYERVRELEGLGVEA